MSDDTRATADTLVRRISSGDLIAVIEAHEFVDAICRRAETGDARDLIRVLRDAGVQHLAQALLVLDGEVDADEVGIVPLSIASSYRANGGRAVSSVSGGVVVWLHAEPVADDADDALLTMLLTETVRTRSTRRVSALVETLRRDPTPNGLLRPEAVGNLAD